MNFNQNIVWNESQLTVFVSPPQTADDSVPLCGGLVHRTDAGWKHCVERFAGAGSKTSSSQERVGSDLDDDEYDHFYYLDGKLRRVQKNFYPYHRGQRRRSSTDDSELGVRRRDTHENLLGFIRQLALRNKASRFRWSGAQDDVQRHTQR